MFGFGKDKKKLIGLPKVLTEVEDPVNYNSVLDYMVGLSPAEYNKILKVSGIYRNANKQAAKVLGVKDEPTTQLKEEKATDEEVDEALDSVLTDGLLEEDEAEKSPKPKKKQASKKKIDVNEG